MFVWDQRMKKSDGRRKKKFYQAEQEDFCERYIKFKGN